MYKLRTGQGKFFGGGGLALLATLSAATAAPRPTPVPAASVSFTNDVVPVLTKLGCNGGSCHGQQNGKGGFRLSLHGWDPASDHEQIARDAKGRRVDSVNPARSLLLRKPAGQVPHGGGTILRPEAPEYRLLARWLEAGTPAPNAATDARLLSLSVTPAEAVLSKTGGQQALKVVAAYSDGTRRNVSRLARYQSQNDAVANVDAAGLVTTKGPGEGPILVSYGGLVRTANFMVPFAPARPTPGARAAAAGFIDQHVEAKLNRLGLTPSGTCTDAEFVRRVYLDTIGLLPSPDETRRFLADKKPDKRALLIDALLERPEYVDCRALKLADLLRVNSLFLADEGADAYYRWIRAQVEANAPYDRIARELLTGRGSTYRDGPANYYRAAQNPEELTEATAQTFLGTRIGCAKCHNHPFENWKQSDYYGLAAFFGRYGRKGGPEFGEEQVFVRREGEVQNPRTKKTARMRYLGGAEVEGEPDTDRRATLAKWLTSRDNRQFARVAANRVWADFFGRGIVEPADDFRVSNPPSNSPLLEAVTDEFIRSGYDQKHLACLILKSQTYQRSSTILPGNARDDRYFARAYPRRLPAEVLLDVMGQVTGKPDRFYPYPGNWRAVQIRDSRVGHSFLEIFGRPKREIVCSCERSPQPNLAQALHLMNSGAVNQKLAAGDGQISRLLKQFEPWAAASRDRGIIEEMYYLTLCRPPTGPEIQRLTAHVAKQKDRRKGLEDALWALLNSKEFLYNR